MSPFRREMMLRVVDGNPTLIPVMHQLTHYRDCDKFLKWLITNNITSKNLVEWLRDTFRNSTMSMVKFIIKKNNKDNETKPIILNKDWFK